MDGDQEMNTFAYLPLLVMYGLAVWRLSLMISSDSGPWRAISRLRSWIRREEKKSPAMKKADVSKGVECGRCNSVHIAAAVAAFAYWHRRWPDWFETAGDLFLGAMALSAISILLGRLFPVK